MTLLLGWYPKIPGDTPEERAHRTKGHRTGLTPADSTSYAGRYQREGRRMDAVSDESPDVDSAGVYFVSAEEFENRKPSDGAPEPPSGERPAKAR
jgi:hypothetical protein